MKVKAYILVKPCVQKCSKNAQKEKKLKIVNVYLYLLSFISYFFNYSFFKLTSTTFTFESSSINKF